MPVFRSDTRKTAICAPIMSNAMWNIARTTRRVNHRRSVLALLNCKTPANESQS